MREIPVGSRRVPHDSFDVVKVIRHSRLSRALLVALMLASWLVLTNHCALAGLIASARAADEAPSCCHRDRAPSPVDDACPQALQCCKTKATLTGNPVIVSEAVLVEILSAPLAILTAPPVAAEAGIAIFEHGPPRRLSFAELVLQRSLLSHAPPFAA